jgi:hypothetical protein
MLLCPEGNRKSSGEITEKRRGTVIFSRLTICTLLHGVAPPCTLM